MVGLGRLELPTSRLSGVRSNQLSYRPVNARRGNAALAPTERSLLQNEIADALDPERVCRFGGIDLSKLPSGHLLST